MTTSMTKEENFAPGVCDARRVREKQPRACSVKKRT